MSNENIVTWKCPAGHQWTAPLRNPDGTINRYLNCVGFLDRWSGIRCPNDGHRIEDVRKRKKPLEKPKYSGTDIYGNAVPANEAARKELRRRS